MSWPRIEGPPASRASSQPDGLLVNQHRGIACRLPEPALSSSSSDSLTLPGLPSAGDATASLPTAQTAAVSNSMARATNRPVALSDVNPDEPRYSENLTSQGRPRHERIKHRDRVPIGSASELVAGHPTTACETCSPCAAKNSRWAASLVRMFRPTPRGRNERRTTTLSASGRVEHSPSEHVPKISPRRGAPIPEKQKTPDLSGVLLGGRYWDRTSDLFRVREARYRCANRPESSAWLSIWRWIRDSNPCIRLCRPLPRLSANPPCMGSPPKEQESSMCLILIRADDEIRTRDPHLGKVMRYHCATSALLSHFCVQRRLYTHFERFTN